MEHPKLYRERLIPQECVLLKDDVIYYRDEELLVTGWKALKPRQDLHHGFSCYYLKEGYKVSRFYDAQGKELYCYCDIIRVRTDSQALVATDLLADVIVYPDGRVKVVDLGEIPKAMDQGLLSIEQLKAALLSLDALLEKIYAGRLPELTAPMDPYIKAMQGEP